MGGFPSGLTTENGESAALFPIAQFSTHYLWYKGESFFTIFPLAAQLRCVAGISPGAHKWPNAEAANY
jgi:hypothetical protein